MVEVEEVGNGCDHESSYKQYLRPKKTYQKKRRNNEQARIWSIYVIGVKGNVIGAVHVAHLNI